MKYATFRYNTIEVENGLYSLVLSTLRQSCYSRCVSEFFGQPCNKSDIFIKLVTSFSKRLVDGVAAASV